MANVQELIQALEAKRPQSPFAQVLANIGVGMQSAQQQSLSRTMKLMALDKARREAEQQAQMQKEFQAAIAGRQENQIKQAHASVAGTPKPVMPAQKLEVEWKQGEKGELSRTFKTAGVKEETFTAREYADPVTGRMKIGKWSASRGLLKSPGDEFADLPKPGGIPGENLKVSNDLRQEFINRPEVKEYVTIGTQVKSMDSMLKNALDGNLDNQLALDQALITMYNKLTDPNSVVRESEYARTPENLPTINRISGSIQKLASGGAGLTNADRKALVLGAKIIANERGNEFNRARKGYVDLSNKMKLDSSLVTGTLPEFNEYKIAPSGKSKIRVSDGKETFLIDPADEDEAARDGFRKVQ